MNYDKYSDKLLAQQDTLPTNTIFKILIGYSWRELSQAEEANNRLEGNASDKELDKGFVSTKKSRVAGRAYALLKKWMGIKFHSDPSGLNLDQSYNTEEFFAWITENSILNKLEAQFTEFKTPERAIEFINYLTPSKIQDQGPAKKTDDGTKNDFFPAPKGTTWKDVTITLIARDTVRISIKGGKSQMFNFSELGMSDKRTGDKPKAMWWVLVHLISENGMISRKTDQYDPILNSSVKGFKQQMKKLFGIEQAVMGHYKKNGGYKAEFQVVNQTLISVQDLLRLPNTP